MNVKRKYYINIISIILPLIVHLSSFQVVSQSLTKVNFTVNFGSAYNSPSYLKITQEGYEDIVIRDANYSTEAFVRPTYWDYKLDFETEKRLFGVRTTHHKLILRNPSPEIEYFEITHGYNLLIGYYGWKMKYFTLLAAGGVAFSHPEGIIHGSHASIEKGVPFIGGIYRVTGPNLELAILRKFYFSKRFFVNIEGRINAGYINCQIKRGFVETYPVGLHGIFGIGYDFINND